MGLNVKFIYFSLRRLLHSDQLLSSFKACLLLTFLSFSFSRSEGQLPASRCIIHWLIAVRWQYSATVGYSVFYSIIFSLGKSTPTCSCNASNGWEISSFIATYKFVYFTTTICLLLFCQTLPILKTYIFWSNQEIVFNWKLPLQEPEAV